MKIIRDLLMGRVFFEKMTTTRCFVKVIINFVRDSILMTVYCGRIISTSVSCRF